MPRQEGGRLGYVDSEGRKSAEAVKLSEGKAKGDGGASAKTELKPRRDDGGTRAWGEKGGQSEWRLDGNLLRLSGSGTSLRSHIASIHFVSAAQRRVGECSPAHSSKLLGTRPSLIRTALPNHRLENSFRPSERHPARRESKFGSRAEATTRAGVVTLSCWYHSTLRRRSDGAAGELGRRRLRARARAGDERDRAGGVQGGGGGAARSEFAVAQAGKPADQRAASVPEPMRRKGRSWARINAFGSTTVWPPQLLSQ